MTKGEQQTQIPRHSDNLQTKGLVIVNHQTRGKYWLYQQIQSKVYAVMYALVVAIYK